LENRKFLFLKYLGSTENKLDNFERYVRGQSFARSLARYGLLGFTAEE